ncbi:MAG: isoaspartyl peptidase/L-asparaginase [Acidobacteriota bacterium]|nr:isoaspartyl peptidase/L-asparaginase [Acidobacteriota bacterium]
MSQADVKPSLIVHGGAGNIPDAAVNDFRRGVRSGLNAGWSVLSRGGAALDAVEAAIVALEEDPALDAGVGSHLNRDGRVQLDAIVMDGGTLKAGAVAAVERIRNPIRLARLVFEKSEHMMLIGRGAEQFAVENGFPLCDPEELITDAARDEWRKTREPSAAGHAEQPRGTVGAVALDSDGNLVAGTSTGGTRGKYPGRVGDSPLIGCGCYADAQAGGISCTGYGEGIMKVVMAKMAADMLRDPGAVAPRESKDSDTRTAQSVADACVRILGNRARAAGGLILLDREGNPAAAYTTPRMAYGYVGAGGVLNIAP